MKVFCQDTRRLRVVPHIEERRAGLGRNLFKTRRDAYLSEAGSGGGFRHGKTIEERNNRRQSARRIAVLIFALERRPRQLPAEFAHAELERTVRMLRHTEIAVDEQKLRADFGSVANER